MTASRETLLQSWRRRLVDPLCRKVLFYLIERYGRTIGSIAALQDRATAVAVDLTPSCGGHSTRSPERIREILQSIHAAAH